MNDLFIALMMGAVGTSEMSVYYNETTRRYITESCHLQYTFLLNAFLHIV
jgi:hypothetical protein